MGPGFHFSLRQVEFSSALMTSVSMLYQSGTCSEVMCVSCLNDLILFMPGEHISVTYIMSYCLVLCLIVFHSSGWSANASLMVATIVVSVVGLTRGGTVSISSVLVVMTICCS